MLKNGFSFEVVKNGIIGELDGLTRPGIWSVCFYENGSMIHRYDVYEQTIINNLKAGLYKEVTR